ncbi:8384_t:CDS:1, partial [Racocetra persica]
ADIEFITNCERKPKPILTNDLTNTYPNDLLTVGPSSLTIREPNSKNSKASSIKSILSRYHG